MKKTKIYFASDFHLGAPTYESSRQRELLIVNWLAHIKEDAAEVFLLGDVFDFWFEYATVIPKGFIRLQGKLAELSDAGIKLYFFKGNHDMWVFDYFKKEFNLTVIDNELIIERANKTFFLHHGDGLGKGDNGYKLLKNFFRSTFCQWLFARIHPNLGIGIANYWSSKSRIAHQKRGDTTDLQKEGIWIKDLYTNLKNGNKDFDYIIMGHRHLPSEIALNNTTKYINLGEWVNYTSYAVFDGENLELRYFNS